MTLGCQVVDLIRLDLLDDADKVGGIRKVSIMKRKTDIFLVGILI